LEFDVGRGGIVPLDLDLHGFELFPVNGVNVGEILNGKHDLLL
jgi:hypothetical protein